MKFTSFSYECMNERITLNLFEFSTLAKLPLVCRIYHITATWQHHSNQQRHLSHWSSVSCALYEMHVSFGCWVNDYLLCTCVCVLYCFGHTNTHIHKHLISNIDDDDDDDNEHQEVECLSHSYVCMNLSVSIRMSLLHYYIVV